MEIRLKSHCTYVWKVKFCPTRVGFCIWFSFNYCLCIMVEPIYRPHKTRKYILCYQLSYRYIQNDWLSQIDLQTVECFMCSKIGHLAKSDISISKQLPHPVPFVLCTLLYSSWIRHHSSATTTEHQPPPQSATSPTTTISICVLCSGSRWMRATEQSKDNTETVPSRVPKSCHGYVTKFNKIQIKLTHLSHNNTPHLPSPHRHLTFT